VDDPQVRQRLGEAAFSGIYKLCRFATKAPVVIVILAHPDVVDLYSVHFCQPDGSARLWNSSE